MTVKTMVVGTEAALLAALRAATGETEIQVKPGFYNYLTIQNINPAAMVTITSFDPANRAVIDTLYVKSSSNLVFEDLYFHDVTASGPQVRVGGSHDISFVGNEFAGVVDASNLNDASGIQLTDSDSVSLLGNQFHDLTFASYALRSNNLVLAGNTVAKVREGFDFSDVDHVTIDSNHFSNFQPLLTGSKPDHPDGIQFWTTGATGSTDVSITNNAFLFGNGLPIQGIFIGNEVGETARHSDFTIANNLYQGQSRHGISVYSTDGVHITGNTVVSAPKAGTALYYDPAINTTNTTGAEIDHNVSAMMFSDRDTGRIAHHNVDAWDLKTGVGVKYADLFGAAPTGTASPDDFLIRAGSAADLVDAGYAPTATVGIWHSALQLNTMLDTPPAIFMIG